MILAAHYYYPTAICSIFQLNTSNSSIIIIDVNVYNIFLLKHESMIVTRLARLLFMRTGNVDMQQAFGQWAREAVRSGQYTMKLHCFVCVFMRSAARWCWHMCNNRMEMLDTINLSKKLLIFTLIWAKNGFYLLASSVIVKWEKYAISL